LNSIQFKISYSVYKSTQKVFSCETKKQISFGHEKSVNSFKKNSLKTAWSDYLVFIFLKELTDFSCPKEICFFVSHEKTFWVGQGENPHKS
jgi:hypothetical protein